MGSVMASRFLPRSESPGPVELHVWNRTGARTAQLVAAGARRAESPAALAKTCDVVISMLHDDDAVRDVFLRADGLIAAGPGKLFIEMSTIRPGTIRELGRAVSSAGSAIIEAPVSGTVGPARDGRLLAFAGGTPDQLERAQPILQRLCRRVIHAGPIGHGALLKLVVNLPLAVYWQALAESLALGRAGGLDYALMLDALQDSSAALAVLGMKTPAILEPQTAAAFDVSSMHKDVLSMIETGSALGVPMPATSVALASYAAAKAHGLGNADAVAIVRFQAEQIARQRESCVQ